MNEIQPSSIYSPFFKLKFMENFYTQSQELLINQSQKCPFQFSRKLSPFFIDCVHQPSNFCLSTQLRMVMMGIIEDQFYIFLINASSDQFLFAENLLDTVKIIQMHMINIICLLALGQRRSVLGSITVLNIQYYVVFLQQIQIMSEQSSSQQQRQHVNPTSPPTNNVVSVLSKMLQAHVPKAEEQQVQIGSNIRKFIFNLDFLIDKQIQKCQVEVEENMKVQSALIQALEKFKVILAQKGYEMDTKLQNFTLRLAKKNGKPKTDMPSIDLKQRFIDLKVTVSSIQIKNPDCIKNTQQQFSKATSHYSIGSQIGNQTPTKRQQLLTQQEMMKKQKNQNCMFSFC